MSSIAEVARVAGVSVTTISHVISGKRPVSDATAARVREVMAELQYVPNHAARSLRSGRTRTLSILVPDISNAYFAELAKGAEDTAEEHGYNLVLCNTDFSPKREARYLSVAQGGAFDGMIYVAGAPLFRRKLMSLARSFPIVIADEEHEGVAAVTIVADNFKGGLLVGEYLAVLGHREALYVGGPEKLATSLERLAGFREGFEAGGRVRATAPGDYRERSGFEAVRSHLESHGRDFTAVFAGNDLMALGAMNALVEAGITVPEQVSVVGYDDIHLASLIRPALTTVRQPVYGIGQAAAGQLILQIERENTGPRTRVVLDVELVVRDSAGERLPA